MRTPKVDRELNICGYTYNEDGTRAQRITIYTSDYSYMAKLDKLVEKNPEEWKVVQEHKHGEDVTGKEYSCPIKYISFRSGVKGAKNTEDMPENTEPDEDSEA